MRVGLWWKQFPLECQRSKDLESILSVSNVAGSRSGREDRDRLRCALEVDGEWLAQEMLGLANVVDEVTDHPSCFDEGETENEINSNIWACGDEEGCLASILGKIGQVDFEPYWQFRRDWLIIGRGDDT
jgi:hypothetical protein